MTAAVRRAVILSGSRGSGKTALCLELAGAFPGFTGIVCPNTLDSNGRESGKSAVCLSTMESWQIARMDAELEGPRLGRFRFSASGMERAVACLRRALRASRSICIIDEIGPLELDKGLGLSPVLPLLDEAERLLLVVRPGLERRVCAIIPRHECRRVILNADNRREIASEIRVFLLG